MLRPPAPAPRYPVVLEQFSLRAGSGGAGKHSGGEGVIRKLLFRERVVLSVLTERRSTRPYGIMGNLSPCSTKTTITELLIQCFNRCRHFHYKSLGVCSYVFVMV